MEKILEKLADKLLTLDEASLTQLWEKYYSTVQRFEPTKRWERAVIILSMIQAMRWKNQLFNVKWLQLTSLEKKFNRRFPAMAQTKKEIAGPVEKEKKGEKHPRDKGEGGKVIHLTSFKTRK